MDDAPIPDASLPRRWEEVDALFQEALDRPEEERTRFVHDRSKGDPVLRAMVLRLLELSTLTNDGFLEFPETLGPFGERAGAARLSAQLRASLPSSGHRIGNFELVEPLGDGGTGVVFRARRVEPDFGQEVAVKILFGTLASGSSQRFEQERSLLARLRHPNIVGLIDGGVTDKGYRYLVMELVEGIPLTDYTFRQALSVHQRVRLMLRVCDAVGFAHGQMIVHGDLKPSNLLVTSDGHPKLLDFGIAQVLHAEGTRPVPGVETSGGGSMSPLYASPEQIAGEGLTVASDVFQIGTLLHEMLSGRNPWVTKARKPGEVLERILQGSPPLPSTVVDEARSAEEAGLGPTRLPARELRGDLDAIVGRCLEVDPAERYGTVREMAADLRRYLDHEPVQARNGRLPYRVAKFTRRRPVVAALLGVVGVVGTLGLGGSLVHSAIVSVERDQTRQEADRADATVDFLVGLLAAAGETGALDTLTAGRLLSLGEALLEGEMPTDPDLQIAILGTLTDAYLRTGRESEALAMDLRRVELARATWGEADPRTGEVLRVAGSRRSQVRHWTSAVELLEASLAIQRDRSGRLTPGAEATRRMRLTLLSLAPAYRESGSPEQAVAAVREAMSLRGGDGPDDTVAVARELGALAFALRGTGELEEAERLYLEALDLARAATPGGQTLLPGLLNNYGSLLRGVGRAEEAEPILRELMAMLEELGEGHQEQREIGYINFISFLSEREKHEEAVAVSMEMNAWIRSLFAPDHWRVGRSTMQVGTAIRQAGDCVSAEPWLRQGMEIYREGLGPDHGWTAVARVGLGACLLQLDRDSEATVLLEGTLEPLLAESTPRPRMIDWALEQMAEVRLREGNGVEVDHLEVLRKALADEGVPGVRSRMAERGAGPAPDPPVLRR
jgi:eukaryotic-like serine/threonine-protein kinase